MSWDNICWFWITVMAVFGAWTVWDVQQHEKGWAGRIDELERLTDGEDRGTDEGA